MMTDSGLDGVVNTLLQPLGGSHATGQWMRYERSYTDLSKAREEDDPNLPLGEWERPLVKANWKQVAADCVRLLQEDSKDFQVAAWLTDAWIRMHQMDGLCAGLTLLHGLAERFWDGAWPAIEEGDTDRRVAPFVWMNTALPLQLILNVALLPADGQREQAIKMLDWERASTRDDAKPDPKSDTPAALTRQAIRASVKPSDAESLRWLVTRSSVSVECLRSLSALLDEQLKQESPSLARLLLMVEAIQTAATSLLQEIPLAVVETATPSATPDPTISSSTTTPAAPVVSATLPAPLNSGFADRAHAYQVLEAAALYLEKIEPHSPTPYMIRRAHQLGQMGLPDMLRQVSADAGSLDKFFSLLGIRPPG